MKMTPDEEAAVQARLIEHVKAHGTDCLTTSRRAVKGFWAFKYRLQAIMDGPIPQAPHNHGALRGFGEAEPSH